MTKKVKTPTAISMKAARLLIKKMKHSPDLPSVDSIALLLDNILHFGWLVRAIHERVEVAEYGQGGDDMISAELREYDTWANKVLF